MNYRQLGSTGVRVSELCLGGMTFGEADESSFMHGVGSDEQTAMGVMNRALDSGINFIDTADVYGQDGLSERVMGTWFEKDGRRDEVVLATKFRFTMGEGPNKSGASRYRIMRCCEDSLRRLKTDRIDLYQIHCQDNSTPEDEILRALDDLVSAGKVLYTGCSNYAAYRLMDSLWTSDTSGLVGFATLQARYSLMFRELERELVPVCREKGLGILPYSPLAGGFLTGKYRKDAEPPAGTRLAKFKERLASYDSERNWTILAALDEVAGQLDTSVGSVALAWLLSKEVVSSVIFGARTTAQLDDNLRAVDLELSAEQVARLDSASDFDPGYPYDFIARVSGGTW